jgi:hypothetical protein
MKWVADETDKIESKGYDRKMHKNRVKERRREQNKE